MPDRVHYHPNLIFSVGTQVVTLVDITGSAGLVLHPRGTVGVVVKSPPDLEHSYRVRFLDGFEAPLKQSEVTMLARFKEGEIGDSGHAAQTDMYERVIYRCVIGSQAYGLADTASDVDRRGIYLPTADLHWSLYGVPEQLENDETQEAYWELQKFLVLALKANPNVLECLYTPLVEKATPLAEELLAMKTIFLSRMVYQTYNGYVMSQFKNMSVCGRSSSRRTRRASCRKRHGEARHCTICWSGCGCRRRCSETAQRMAVMGASRDDFTKYPRTPHLFGARGTDDDKHLGQQESLDFIADASLIVEEKLDGTNVGIHFTSAGRMVLQCRGHEITAGMHAQYDLFKQWTMAKRALLEAMLEDQFLLYGEWLYARHSLHYRRLPHYFFEFDIYDKWRHVFLDLAGRLELLDGTGILTVPVLNRGPATADQLGGLVGPSQFDSQFENPVTGRTDNLMEGLCLRTEAKGRVTGRAKFVRPVFVEKVKQSEHWQHRAVVPNLLAQGADIWS